MTTWWLLLALATLLAPALPRSAGDRCPAGLGGGRGSTALLLDLAAAALRSGKPVAAALELSLAAAAPPVAAALGEVVGLIRLGADPVDAWSGMPRDGPLGEVRRAAVRSASSGLRLAAAFERLAGDLRAQAAALATARAHRAGVAALGPLAACFLPSFVCLGIVPVVVGVARAALAGVAT
jgi:Flp pilus assembly protein TadB